MNEYYCMGLTNFCDYNLINYPQYALDRVNKTKFANANQGFLKGNIECDTYKGYKNYLPGNIKVNNERDRLLLDIQMYGFYLTDLGLYLDMHPTDKEALRLFNETRVKYYKKVEEFDSKYYPLNSFYSNKNDSYEWLDGEFPFMRGN